MVKEKIVNSDKIYLIDVGGVKIGRNRWQQIR